MQIIPEPIFLAKQTGGHESYKRAGRLPVGPEKVRLNKEQRDLYSAALSVLGDEWEEILERTGRLK